MQTSINDKATTQEKDSTPSIYRKKNKNDLIRNLFQGDILDPDLLKGNLEGHQSYFQRNYFVRYMVLTQTCDLVLEKSAETPRLPVDFIQLAVVRKMSDVFGRKHADNKSNTKNQLKKILGYLPDKRGLFYLPVDINHGITEPCVVDLRVSFSLYKIHYEDLICARLGGLNDLYAAQLGQMIAYMFSRVAMPEPSKGEINDICSEIVEREENRLRELVASLSVKRCMVKDCLGACDTYRYLKFGQIGDKNEFEEIVLCKNHAKLNDSGELLSKSGCIIRIDNGLENSSKRKGGAE